MGARAIRSLVDVRVVSTSTQKPAGTGATAAVVIISVRPQVGRMSSTCGGGGQEPMTVVITLVGSGLMPSPTTEEIDIAGFGMGSILAVPVPAAEQVPEKLAIFGSMLSQDIEETDKTGADLVAFDSGQKTEVEATAIWGSPVIAEIEEVSNTTSVAGLLLAIPDFAFWGVATRVIGSGSKPNPETVEVVISAVETGAVSIAFRWEPATTMFVGTGPTAFQDTDDTVNRVSGVGSGVHGTGLVEQTTSPEVVSFCSGVGV